MARYPLLKDTLREDTMQITSIFKVTVSVVELTLLSKKGHAISDLQMTKWLVPMYPLSGGSTVHTIWMLYSTCISTVVEGTKKVSVTTHNMQIVWPPACVHAWAY